MQQIYLDYNASTPIAPEVAGAMRNFIDAAYGNPSSQHWAGIPARKALATARAQVAALINAAPDEIVFTSGGSESNNLALKGVFHAAGDRDRHIVTSTIEHPAIIAPCQFLEHLGARISYVPVDAAGSVDPVAVDRMISDTTILVSIMHANNEVGTVQPVAEIASLARSRGILMHTDAAQSVGKVPIDVDELGVDLLSIAGHKLYAPKGIGALYIRNGVSLVPLIHGAGHERGRRAGTESVLLAAALGAACEVAARWLSGSDLEMLRDYFWQQLSESFGRGSS